MTDENKFFRFVWRFNAVLLLLAMGFLAVLIAGKAWKPDFDPLNFNRPSAYLEAQMKAASLQHYFLAPVEVVYGVENPTPPETLYSLSRQRNGFDMFEPFAAAEAVNVLALDEKAKTSRWLFAPGKRVILSQTMLHNYETTKVPNTEQDAYITRVIGLAMIVVDTDTDKDGKLTSKDRQALYFYRLDGKAPAKILSAGRILLQTGTGETKHLHLFYQDEGKTFAVSYSVPAFELSSKIAVSGMPQLQGTAGQVPANLETITLTGASE